jgi:hypothetical protein
MSRPPVSICPRRTLGAMNEEPESPPTAEQMKSFEARGAAMRSRACAQILENLAGMESDGLTHVQMARRGR